MAIWLNPAKTPTRAQVQKFFAENDFKSYEHLQQHRIIAINNFLNAAVDHFKVQSKDEWKWRLVAQWYDDDGHPLNKPIVHATKNRSFEDEIPTVKRSNRPNPRMRKRMKEQQRIQTFMATLQSFEHLAVVSGTIPKGILS